MRIRTLTLALILAFTISKAPAQNDDYHATMEMKPDGENSVVTLTAPEDHWNCWARRQAWGVVTASCRLGSDRMDTIPRISGFTASSSITAKGRSGGGRQILTLTIPKGWKSEMMWGDSGHLESVTIHIYPDRKQE